MMLKPRWRPGEPKITPRHVREIRARRAGLKKRERGKNGAAYWEIARDYGLNPMHVARICQGHIWKGVT